MLQPHAGLSDLLSLVDQLAGQIFDATTEACMLLVPVRHNCQRHSVDPRFYYSLQELCCLLISFPWVIYAIVMHTGV